MPLAFSRPTADIAEQRVLFSLFRESGYDGLQMKGAQYGAYLDDAHKFLYEWPLAHGANAGLITGGKLDEYGIARLKKVIRFAAAIDSPSIVFCHDHSRDGVTPDLLRVFADTLSALARESLQTGVKLSLHHHFNNPVMHRSDFDTFFDAADPALGLTIDTAHAVKSGIQDVAELIRTFRGRIDNYHIKDFSGTGATGIFKTLGQGEIDFAPIFDAIHETKFSGWLVADEESGGEMLPTLRESLAFLKSRKKCGR
jgi:inosose dehydratase